MKFLYIYIYTFVCVLWFWDWFLFFDSFSSLERRNGNSYEKGEVKRRYSSFLGDFEKEYIFPLDCKGSAGWTQYLRRKKG